MGRVQNIGFAKYKEGVELRLDVTRSIFNRKSLDVGILSVSQGVGTPIDLKSLQELTGFDVSQVQVDLNASLLSITETELTKIINRLAEWADEVKSCPEALS